jgi:hypothetical protein
MLLLCCADHLQDKKYCATINVVLSGYTVSNAPSGFPRQITLPFSVCWYKHNGQARARFSFGSCGAGGGESAGPAWLGQLLFFTIWSMCCCRIMVLWVHTPSVCGCLIAV